MDQEKIRRITNQWIRSSGIKAIHICECCKINPTYFSKWRHGKRFLNDDSLTGLVKYLKQQGIGIG